MTKSDFKPGDRVISLIHGEFYGRSATVVTEEEYRSVWNEPTMDFCIPVKFDTPRISDGASILSAGALYFAFDYQIEIDSEIERYIRNNKIDVNFVLRTALNIGGKVEDIPDNIRHIEL